MLLSGGRSRRAVARAVDGQERPRDLLGLHDPLAPQVRDEGLHRAGAGRPKRRRGVADSQLAQVRWPS